MVSVHYCTYVDLITAIIPPVKLDAHDQSTHQIILTLLLK